MPQCRTNRQRRLRRRRKHEIQLRVKWLWQELSKHSVVRGQIPPSAPAEPPTVTIQTALIVIRPTVTVPAAWS